ncbi:MAG: transcriptional repressor [Lachnospiraceae bacterium]|uniref:Transcriptional repressor n=1 Tax=Candidatus Weimeria bifida TaxID=2599074 RepID=A0A6N7IZM3_9FIRM|nr:transcriptional repressor [Candidatus Weimeria bifida]RRF95020.1 MAG: transcriptional repressor [Lachnospiraceae bacterium]
MKRFSKRRQLILDNLAGRSDHPTAEMVFSSVRDQIPNISLGTVYRNLKELAEQGTILSFSQNGKEHFDGNSKPHIHICCVNCGRIEDRPLPDSLRFVNEDSFLVKNVIVQGICSDCAKKSEVS